jgi:lipopolysaccharide/colanic/teichoic acid biosynthesis glycosyltransferase
VRMEHEYIRNWSLALDLRILWRTVGAVVRGDGAH